MPYHLVRTKFSREFLYYFTVKNASSLLLGSNHSAPRLLHGALTSEARSRLQ